VESKYNHLIEMVNLSLKNEPSNLVITEEDLKLIKANQLSGLAVSSLKEELQEKSIYQNLKRDYYLYIKIDEIQKTLIEELRNLFNDNKIDFIFLKGSYLKTLYPETYLRSMGDIDVLVRKDKMEEIHKILEDNGFSNWTNSSSHDCFMKNKINVEIHPLLDSDFSNEYQDLFIKPWSYTYKLNEYEYQLYPEYNFFYQLYHLTKHLYHSGVGYRSIIDLYLLLKANEKAINEERFKEIFNKFPHSKFINNILVIINNNFSNELLNEIHKNDRILIASHRDFLDFLFEAGTHGTGEGHNLFIGDIARRHNKKEWIVFTKIKFLFSKTFLPYKQMKGMYRYLVKCPILLPFAWIARFFKLLFSKTSRSKLKRLEVSKEEVLRVEEIFKNIGIN
jgi:hypothetical protein